MDHARDLHERVERRAHIVCHAGQLLLETDLSRCVGFQDVELQRQGYELLLHTVVQVALDTAARHVRRGHHPSARRGELRLAFRVRDRGGEQLGELLEPNVGIDGQWLAGRDGGRPPEFALHDDWARNRRDDAQRRRPEPCTCRFATTESVARILP
jgi:hypothetical protein